MDQRPVIIDELTGRPLTGTDCIRDRIDEVFTRWEAGESMRSIAESMPIHVTPSTISYVMRSTPEWMMRYEAAQEFRAQELIERTVRIAEKGEQLGDAAGLRVASDTYMKLAAKLAPNKYGDKAQLQISGAVVRAEDLSDAELARAVAKGQTSADA